MMLAQLGPSQETDKTLICFTDGSALNNGKHNAKAGYATVWPYHEELNSSIPLKTNPTNNRAEYTAIIHAINQADVLDPEHNKTLIIYTDSMLLVNSMTKWLPNWKRSNYMKHDGKPVLNQDLIKTIDQLSKTRKIAYRHVRAHTNASTWEAKYNAIADNLARQAAQN